MSNPKHRPPKPGLEHSKCLFSTDIGGSITAGQGKMDGYGYFEIPCPECAAKAQKHVDEQGGNE